MVMHHVENARYVRPLMGMDRHAFCGIGIAGPIVSLSLCDPATGDHARMIRQGNRNVKVRTGIGGSRRFRLKLFEVRELPGSHNILQVDRAQAIDTDHDNIFRAPN